MTVWGHTIVLLLSVYGQEKSVHWLLDVHPVQVLHTHTINTHVIDYLKTKYNYMYVQSLSSDLLIGSIHIVKDFIML